MFVLDTSADNKKRVNQWLNVNKLQLPLRSTTDNSTNNILPKEADVNNNYRKYNTKKEPAGSLSPELSLQGNVSLTGSVISISVLLDKINSSYLLLYKRTIIKKSW